MDFLIVLVCVVVACVVLRTPLMRAPAVFYVLAFVLDALFLAGCVGMISQPVWGVLFVLVRRCLLSCALLTVVMFVGVLPHGSKARTWLGAIRGELSIVACIILVGHAGFYAASYVPRALGMQSGAMIAGLAIAVVLVVLAFVLGITSLRVVKTHMNASTWKKLQRLAYVFYGLMFVHVACLLLPSALFGATTAQQSMVVYTVVFAAYAVLRICRMAVDKEEKVVSSGETGSALLPSDLPYQE